MICMQFLIQTLLIQVLHEVQILQRHPREAVIVYCLSRKESEKVAAELIKQGVRAAVYHAGMGNEKRTATQERFDREEIDVVVATVAFGMGIDRSNVRCVIHVSMPKSVEQFAAVVRGFEVQENCTLVGGQVVVEARCLGIRRVIGEGAPAPKRISGRRLDLDDVGSQVRQQLRAIGRCDVLTDFQDAQSSEGRGGHGLTVPP